MSVIAELEEAESALVRTRSRKFWTRRVWLVPTGLAAAAAIASWFVVRPASQLADTDLNELEAALISSWQVTTEGIADDEDDAISLFSLDDLGDL